MAADYRHIGGVENRLGRHYSRFSPFSPTPALADQSLAWRKLWNAGSNRRSRASVGPQADDELHPADTVENKETTVVASDREPTLRPR